MPELTQYRFSREGIECPDYRAIGEPCSVCRYDSAGYVERCDDCGGDRRYHCRSCGDCYCDGACPDCDNCPCTCEDDSPPDGLHSYNYRPDPQFHGDRAPFYGVEIEVTTDERLAAVEIVESYAGSLIYCKEDGSVDGVELVTHPMSFDWAMERFPWRMLSALKSEADATIIPQENGIHIHVGRDGFDCPSHIYRWLKLWYRNPQDIQRIARRRSSGWAAFSPEHRKGQKQHVMRGKPGYSQYEDPTMHERYSAINTQNSKTLEVRVFASTLRPVRLKAAIQLVAGTVEYARQLNSETVIRRYGWDWKAFIAWAAKQGAYADLISENRTRR
jgi:hypothetical protein